MAAAAANGYRRAHPLFRGAPLKRIWPTVPVFGAFLYAACVSEATDTMLRAPEGNPDGAASSSGASSGASSGVTDGSVDAPPGCTEPATCSANELLRCGATVEQCALGCIDESGGSRCRSFDPVGTPRGSELRLDGLEPLVLDDDYVFDTDTGAVSRIGADGSRAPLREANASEGPSVSAGIGYRRYADRAVFYFRSLTVQAGVPRNFVGTRPLTIVADTVHVRGRWFLPCGRLGGGSLLSPGLGAGAAGEQGSLPAPQTGGGGGAGHATAGGTALKGTAGADASRVEGAPGAPGPAYGGMPFEPLLGGSLGGPTSASGLEAGGGGAALQLIALREIVVGGGEATVSGVSVGGCGGHTPMEFGGGSGGGSGGTLLLEAPSIRLERNAVLAANGGGGGAAASPDGVATPTFDEPAGTADAHLAPNDGALSTEGAGRDPDNQSMAYVYGGLGGSAATPTPHDLRAKATPYWTSASDRGRVSGPGGGGSHGFVYLFTRSGALTVQDATAATSPSAAPFFAVGSLVLE